MAVAPEGNRSPLSVCMSLYVHGVLFLYVEQKNSFLTKQKWNIEDIEPT